MHTASRVLLWTVISLVVVVVLAAVALRALDWNALKDDIGARLSERLGQEVAIRGDLDVDIGPGVIRVQAQDIRIEDTLPRPQALLTIERLRAGLELRPLLGGDLVFDYITLARPQVTLIRTADGEVNWDFEVLRAEEPEAPAALPVVRRLDVEDARVVYRDAALDATLQASIGEARARMSRDGALRATGSGEIESRDLSFAVRAEPVEDGGNRRVQAQAELAGARLSVAGTLLEPDLKVTLRVPQPAQLGFLPLPGLADMEEVGLTTRLTRDEGHWWLDGLELALGERRLDGDVRIDLETSPPMIYATLYLEELELPEPDIEERELIPPAAIPTAALKLANLRADLRIGRIANAPVPVGDVNLLVHLYGGRLTVRPLSANVGPGTLEGDIVYDAARAFPASTARLSLRGFELAPVVPGEENPVTGEVNGSIDLHSRGEDLEELAANLNGQLLFVIRAGSVNATWVEALNLDVAGWLAAAARPGTAKTSIRCALVAFDVDNGVLSAQPVVLDTEDSVITVEGAIDLGTEELDLTLNAFPKDPSVLAAQGPIRIEGSLVEPSIDVLTEPVTGRGAAALALGALAGPFAALIPLIEPGLAEDQNCGRLLGDEPRTPPPAGKQ